MEDMKNLMDVFTREEGVEESQQLRSNAFLQLKSYCLELLDLLQNPKKHASAIPGLLQFLRNSPATTLQPFFDYTLFPILLLLDGAIECRSTKKVDSEKLPAVDVPRIPFKVNDSVAEGVVNCLQELLRKCCLKSVDQIQRLQEDIKVLSNANVMLLDQWENILFKLNDSRRYKRTVGSIAGSCITAATPLLASLRRETCLAALDVIEVTFDQDAFTHKTYDHLCEIIQMKSACRLSLSLVK